MDARQETEDRKAEAFRAEGFTRQNPADFRSCPDQEIEKVVRIPSPA